MSEARLILVIGSDDFLLSLKMNELLTDLIPESEREFGLETIDGAVETIDSAAQAMDQTRNALVQQGFFSENKTVWMKNAAFFDSKRLDGSIDFGAKIDAFCDWLRDPGIPEGCTLLISSLSIPKSGRFYKTAASLEKKGQAKILTLSDPSERDAHFVVKKAAEKLGVTISDSVVDAVVKHVGCSPRVLMMETEKLCLYTGGAEPSTEDISTICTAHTDGEFWNLTDAFGLRNLTGTLNVLSNLVEKRVAPVFLIMQLQTRLNEIYLINDSVRTKRLTASGQWVPGLSSEEKEAVGRLGKFDISKKPSWKFSQLMLQARKWTPKQIRYARKTLITAHERMTSISVDPKVLLETAIADALSE